MSGEKLLLRIDEAAERLSIGRTKAYELARAGVIPTVRLGRSRRVPAKALEEWVASQVVETLDAGLSSRPRVLEGR